MTHSAQLFADVADDVRVSETPLVDKGFARVAGSRSSRPRSADDPSPVFPHESVHQPIGRHVDDEDRHDQDAGGHVRLLGRDAFARQLVEMHGESPRPVEERGRRRDDVKTHRRPSPRLARQITCRYIVMASQPSIAESLRSERPSHGQEDETAMRPRRDREVGEETRHLAKPNGG